MSSYVKQIKNVSNVLSVPRLAYVSINLAYVAPFFFLGITIKEKNWYYPQESMTHPELLIIGTLTTIERMIHARVNQNCDKNQEDKEY